MSTQLEGVDPFTLPAAGTLVAYTSATINTSGQIATTANATTRSDGVIQHAAVVNDQTRVAPRGILKVKLGGTVTVGALAAVKGDGTGTYVVSVTSGDFRVGVFLDAGVSGDIVRMLVREGLPNVP